MNTTAHDDARRPPHGGVPGEVRAPTERSVQPDRPGGTTPLPEELRERYGPVVEGYVGTPEVARRNARAQDLARNGQAVSQIYDESRDVFAVIGDQGTVIRHLRAHDPDIPDYASPVAPLMPEEQLRVPPPYVQSERGRREVDEESKKNRERDEQMARDERHDATRRALAERDEGAGTVSRAPTPDRQEAQRRQMQGQGQPGGAPGAQGSQDRSRGAQEEKKEKEEKR